MNLNRTNIIIALLDDILVEKYVTSEDKAANLDRIAETATRMARNIRRHLKDERNRNRVEPVPVFPHRRNAVLCAEPTCIDKNLGHSLYCATHAMHEGHTDT